MHDYPTVVYEGPIASQYSPRLPTCLAGGFFGLALRPIAITIRLITSVHSRFCRCDVRSPNRSKNQQTLSYTLTRTPRSSGRFRLGLRQLWISQRPAISSKCFARLATIDARQTAGQHRRLKEPTKAGTRSLRANVSRRNEGS